MKRLIISLVLGGAFLLAPAFNNPADAKAKLHHHRHHHVHSAIGSGSAFKRGRLICAINVNRWLRAHGFHHTDSASSKSFLKFTRIARADARYGDVRFNYRRGGGHVMIVLGWFKGALRCLNPSSRLQGWVDKVCPAGGDFRRTS